MIACKQVHESISGKGVVTLPGRDAAGTKKAARYYYIPARMDSFGLKHRLHHLFE